MCFFLVSRSAPAKQLAKQQPISSVFDWPVMSTLACQLLIHLITLFSGWQMANQFRAKDFKRDLEGDFEPNLTNTVVFELMAAMHAASFLANYDGHPFMQPLSANKPLMYSFDLLRHRHRGMCIWSHSGSESFAVIGPESFARVSAQNSAVGCGRHCFVLRNGSMYQPFGTPLARSVCRAACSSTGFVQWKGSIWKVQVMQRRHDGYMTERAPLRCLMHWEAIPKQKKRTMSSGLAGEWRVCPCQCVAMLCFFFQIWNH